MPTEPSQANDISPSLHVARLMDGYLTTQLLYVAVKLGIAELLAAGPQAIQTISTASGADEGALYRVMRGLAAEHILTELPGRRFALTDLGACLRREGPGALGGPILARGDLYARAATGLLEAVRTGGTAFDNAFGDTFFNFLASHPDLGDTFQQSMTARARQEVDDVVASYDFGHFTNVMDVGGGTGTLLARILAGHPHLRGTLFDRPPVIPLARDHLATAGVADRCTFIGGDFFESLPSGNDLHILSRVIHDWGDEDASRILVTCRSAIAQGGTLLLVETVLPDHAADNPAAIRMDLHMLVLFASRERSAMEYEHLLTASGFTAPRIVPTASPVGLALLEARAS